jgi:chromosome segregation ATPase
MISETMKSLTEELSKLNGLITTAQMELSDAHNRSILLDAKLEAVSAELADVKQEARRTESECMSKYMIEHASLIEATNKIKSLEMALGEAKMAVVDAAESLGGLGSQLNKNADRITQMETWLKKIEDLDPQEHAAAVTYAKAALMGHQMVVG